MLLLTSGRRMGLVSIAITRAADRKRRPSHVTPLQLRTLPQSYLSERLGFPEGWHMSRGECDFSTLSQAKQPMHTGPAGVCALHLPVHSRDRKRRSPTYRKRRSSVLAWPGMAPRVH